ncbi:hypothetical protein NmNIID838_11970 [Neisseria meningitidis]|uniref:Transposase for insertion sequence element IS1106 n=1 Tax=Neisseria meningitidis TaxID=487 RepID=A0AAC9CTD4_NEIME|nr:Transposase for insertion sequence element IS1106 [Neisseria meningitidis]ANW94206.1 Transposase for insertion sequence element IS1106 [Neisseria meningitidis]BEQ18527.1 hypothetical protein NmNIID835_11740 [Neisseria meningitidis]BEQ18546.1 hypothetical protein NmNIID835_11930 [Neisseria meningitidis]BEQ19751.1 hypothetical protein NmNIID836_03430 [Neisseria meningitidis]
MLIHYTLCRYRNWLAQDNTLSELLELINCQLTEKGLKVEKALTPPLFRPLAANSVRP